MHVIIESGDSTLVMSLLWHLHYFFTVARLIHQRGSALLVSHKTSLVESNTFVEVKNLDWSQDACYD